MIKTIINDHVVKPIKIKKKTHLIRGFDICPELYCNIYLVAPTNCGKTTVTKHMLDVMAGPETEIILFVSTAGTDDNWKAIRKHFIEKGITIVVNTSIIDEKTGEDTLKLYMKLIEKEAEKKEEEKKKAKRRAKTLMDIINASDSRNKIEEKEKQPRIKSPRWIYVFDDLSDELKSRSYQAFLKKARNYGIKSITSSQYIKDILPASRNQIRIWLIFRGLTEDELFQAWKDLKLKMPFDVFADYYEDATEPSSDAPKPFFYINQRDKDYRRNFNQKYTIDDKYL